MLEERKGGGEKEKENMEGQARAKSQAWSHPRGPPASTVPPDRLRLSQRSWGGGGTEGQGLPGTAGDMHPGSGPSNLAICRPEAAQGAGSLERAKGGCKAEGKSEGRWAAKAVRASRVSDDR